MIRAAMVGMGWWGKTLVESVQGVSPDLQFVAAVARTHTDELTLGLGYNRRFHPEIRTWPRPPDILDARAPGR